MSRSLPDENLSSFGGGEASQKLLVKSAYRLIECDKVHFEKYVARYSDVDRKGRNASDESTIIINGPGVSELHSRL